MSCSYIKAYFAYLELLKFIKETTVCETINLDRDTPSRNDSCEKLDAKNHRRKNPLLNTIFHFPVVGILILIDSSWVLMNYAD